MGSIRFDTGVHNTRLDGAERAWMSNVVKDLALAAIGPIWKTDSWVSRLLPPGHYLLTTSAQHFEDSFRTWVRVSGQGMRHPATGAQLDPFAVVLNTALAVGGNVVRLMARIHSQCEIHGFIPPEDCEFVAGIIAKGRKSGLLRPEMGWQGVSELLKTAALDGKPVVMSYSVTETFPGWNGDTDEPGDWDAAFAALDKSLALKHEGWDAYYFGDGLTFFDLHEAATLAERYPNAAKATPPTP